MLIGLPLISRSEVCDPKPSPFAYLKNEHICGRPLGLRFDKRTGDLYIADAYFGLMKVGPEGGQAIVLTSEAEGVPLRFTNDLDIDDEGNVYFTDSSTKYQRRLLLLLCFLPIFDALKRSIGHALSCSLGSLLEATI